MTAKVYTCFNAMRKDQLAQEQARKDRAKRMQDLANTYKKPKAPANVDL